MPYSKKLLTSKCNNALNTLWTRYFFFYRFCKALFVGLRGKGNNYHKLASNKFVHNRKYFEAA